MSESVSHTDSMHLHRQDGGDKASQQSERSLYHAHCQDCLNSHIQDSDKGPKLQMDAALDQLSFYRNSANDAEVVNAINRLMDAVRQSDAYQLGRVGQIKALTESIFQSTSSAHSRGQEAAGVVYSSASQRKKNPFAAKVPESESASKSDAKTSDSSDRKMDQSVQKRQSFLSRLRSLLK